ncbi:MAG: MoxR family ATPase [Dehalococcoidia bacterium]
MTLAFQPDPDGPGNLAAGRPAGQFKENFERLLSEVSAVVVAPEHTLRLALLGLFAQGHVLVEDRPGVGKTMLAKSIAQAIDGTFTRVQFTPDLLPSDITGSSVFNAQTNSFEFLQGPVFANIMLADELNRTNPRTQSALLEAMAEGQVTADGETRPLPAPFMVIATQNTLDSTGTFPLPDTELDRFLTRISIGMPEPDAELEIIARAEHGNPEVSPVLGVDDVLVMQAVVREVQVSLPLREYLVRLAGTIRSHPSVRGGMSPRGTVLLSRAAQGWAAFEGRDYVSPDDVHAVAVAVLAHRIHTDERDSTAAASIVQEVLRRVAVPV